MIRHPAIVPFALLLVVALVVPLPAIAEEGDDALPPLTTRLIDVGALTAGRPDFGRERPPLHLVHLGLDEGDEEWPLFGFEGEEPILPLGTIDELIELVKNAVRPVFWEEREGADIRSMGERVLVVRADPDVLDAVVAFLRTRERQVGRMVAIDVHTVRLPREEAIMLLGADGATEAMTALLERPDAGPSLALTAVAGMQAAACAGSQWAYVAGHDVEVAQESRIVDPIVSVANLGLLVDVRALPVADTGDVLVGLDATLSRRKDVRQANAGATGTLEMPTFAVTHARAAVIVPAGRWTLVDGVGVEGTPGEDGWYFLLRATLRETPASDGIPRILDLPRLPAHAHLTWEDLEIRYHPVHALGAWVRMEVGRGSHLTPSGYQPPEPPEIPEPMPAVPPEALVDLLREIAPESTWDDPCSIEVRNGILVVRQTPEVHAAIEVFLAALRGDRLRTLGITAQIFDLPAAVARRLGAGGAIAREAIVELVLATQAGTARRVGVARTTAFSGSRNTITSGRLVSYVCDYDPEIAQDAVILRPETAAFLEGIEFDVRPHLSVDGRSAEIQIRFLHTHQAAPMRTWATEENATLDLPELAVQRLRTQLVLPLGQPALVGAWGEGERRRVLLVTVKER